ncbi:histidinol dehydrogenase [Calditerrivibrio nitroreducens]|uniref:Histidinol dehydrogenase n=1 Tax=Calditerrivibrio nitroreducens (strain DSM 19672 / NBRC 101217 / Yu37-1) TaxID=768670 RepID=E4TJB8_CALNY|nr:histidinol dehydrogenase [Calditerrivibrio nitroreducens]ADR19185.1 histidinol dehydrogenase [Calditerrivibrio nitroreducens DSM 19672]
MIYKDTNEILPKILKRSDDYEEKYLSTVLSIIDDVKKNGDSALKIYSKKFDNNPDENLEVTKKEMISAYDNIDEQLKLDLQLAKKNIEEYHKNQLEKSWFIEKEGTILGQKITPLDKVGVYVPGGKASYPSTVLMNVIPAKVAGVKEVIVVTPAKDGKISEIVLAACYIAGVDKIFKIGGAQAIAALSYGTETIPKVDKIVGPGNIYVALAKKLVFGRVDIDMIAGPSEILIIADDSANPEYVAADMLSQAEHDELASSITITDSPNLAKEIEKYLNIHLKSLPKKDIAEKSLKQYGGVIVVKNINEAVELSNSIAPEHLELAVKNPFELLPKIKHAGAIFLGHYTPEAMGDYFAGPNHTLPTGGTARFSSPLGTYDFFKRSSIISYTRDSFLKQRENVYRLAKSEDLDAHALSVKVRG